LLGRVGAEIGWCILSDLNTLNRKIEANVTVGSDFNAASVLWKKVRQGILKSLEV